MIESKYNYYTQDGDKMICLNGISKMVFSVPRHDEPELRCRAEAAGRGRPLYPTGNRSTGTAN